MSAGPTRESVPGGIMELQPRGYKKVVQLIDKGATIPNPLSLHIGDEVDLSRVSARGLTIYPGCRIYGVKTVISPGVTLGAEGPVTVEDCALGPKVELKGGFFRQSCFLRRPAWVSGQRCGQVVCWRRKRAERTPSG